MSYSAEESSPVTYFESCCICEEEFSSDSELATHLLDHANEDIFKSSLQKLEEKASRKSESSRLGNVQAKATNIGGQKRTFSQRSTSPEVFIVSDDSDDESTKNKKPVGTTNIVRLVKSVTNNSPKSQLPVNAKTTTPNSAVVNSKPPAPNSVPSVVKPSVPNPNAPATKRGQNNFNCTQCPMVFSNINLYKEHFKTHTQDHPDKTRPYSCQICNKKFAYKGTLRQHLHLHIGEKAMFVRSAIRSSLKRMLRQHEETHEQEKK
ncbi:uncharacterized protein CEXT_251431 [Caerostris extrusa]|uniref:C2H2-type domain-containing protein n=1 Tax=Caerostris extrusa TaxID=172846 RepID=A0AAV4NGW6_CAEEX|nr:uncharacterized protein CEXT_251431 [Caerostris extrusa]